MLAAEYGLTPRQADALSVREAVVMMHGARERRRGRLEHTALILDGLAAYAGFGGRAGVDFGSHYRAFTGAAGPERITDEERARLREKAAAHRALRASLRGEA